MKPTTVKCTIRGLTPLLVNRFSDEAAQDATAGTRKTHRTKARLSPRDDAQGRLYQTGAKRQRDQVIPSENLLACLVEAGRFLKVGKRQLSTQKASLVAAWVTFEDPHTRIVHKAPWSVDSRPVRIPATGGRILRHRPRFDDWKLSFAIQLHPILDLGGADVARELVDIAGAVVGLCDFRPSTRGPFGRFRVDRWVVS